MSEFRQNGAELLRVLERTGDPAAAPNTAFMYAKDVAGVTNVFTRLSDGSILNLSGGSTTTLDGAYDGGGSGAGRTITADAGAVVVTSSAADNNNILELTKTPAALQSGDGLAVTMGANTTGNGVDISHTGASGGVGLNIDRSPGSSSAARGLAVTMGANATGNAMQVTNGGTGNALNLRHNGATATFAALDLAVNNSTAARGVFITEDASVRTVPLVDITRDAAATGPLMDLDNNGAGNALTVTQGGAADALNISIDGASATGQAIVVTETAVNRSTPMISLTRDAAVVTGGAHVIEIVSASTAVDAININNEGGRAIRIDHGSSGDAISINIDSTSTAAQGLVITETSQNRVNPMVRLSRATGVTSTTGDVIEIVDAGDGQSIDLNKSGSNEAIALNLTSTTDNQAIVVAEDNIARSLTMVSLTRQANATGRVLNIVNNGTNTGINLDADGTGNGIVVNVGNASNTRGLRVQDASTIAPTTALVEFDRNEGGTGTILVLQKLPTASTAGDLAHFQSGANATGRVLYLDGNGSGNSLQIDHTSDADAIGISLDGTGTTGQALVVTETNVARTTSMVSLTRAASATGDVLEITNAGSGFSIDVVSGQVRFQTAQALGGGASATLGTIGGSGPTAAAQNEWIRIDSQNGTRFVPAWA